MKKLFLGYLILLVKYGLKKVIRIYEKDIMKDLNTSDESYDKESSIVNVYFNIRFSLGNSLNTYLRLKCS